MSVETELYLVDAARLKNQVGPAIAEFVNRENSAAADELLQNTLLSKPFQELLRVNPVLADYFAQGSRDILDGKPPGKMMDDATGELTADPLIIRKRSTERVLARFLVLFSCARYTDDIPNGIPLNRGVLADYIRSQSQWIDETLSLSNSFLWETQDLEPQIGGEAKLLTREQASTLLDALLKIPTPAKGALRSQYENLKLLLKTAVDDERYRVLILTG